MRSKKKKNERIFSILAFIHFKNSFRISFAFAFASYVNVLCFILYSALVSMFILKINKSIIFMGILHAIQGAPAVKVKIN